MVPTPLLLTDSPWYLHLPFLHRAHGTYTFPPHTEPMVPTPSLLTQSPWYLHHSSSHRAHGTYTFPSHIVPMVLTPLLLTHRPWHLSFWQSAHGTYTFPSHTEPMVLSTLCLLQPAPGWSWTWVFPQRCRLRSHCHTCRDLYPQRTKKRTCSTLKQESWGLKVDLPAWFHGCHVTSSITNNTWSFLCSRANHGEAKISSETTELRTHGWYSQMAKSLGYEEKYSKL